MEAEPENKKSRRPRTLAMRIVFACVLLITLICVFYTFENWRWKRAWNSYVDARKSKGLWFDSHVELPPDDENYAAIPLLKPLIGPDPNHKQGLRVLTPKEFKVPSFQLYKIEADRPIIRPFMGNREWLRPINLKGFQDYYRGGTNVISEETHRRSVEDYLKRIAMGHGESPFPVSEKPQSAAQDVLLALSIHDQHLKQLTDELDRPHARFQTDYEPASITVRHLAMAKGIIFLIRTRATAHMENGSSDLALQDVLNSYRISLQFTRDPLIISLLVRYACIELTHHGLWEGLRRRLWNDSQLSAIQDQLSQMDYFASFTESLQAERTIFGQTLLSTEYERKPIVQSWSNPDDNRNYLLFIRWAPAGWFYSSAREVGLLCDDLDKAIATHQTILGLPLNQSRSARWETSPNGANYLARIHFGPLDKHWLKVCRAQTHLNQAITACALEQFHFKHQRYPDELEELVPDFIRAVPTDHVDGKALRYRLSGDRYRVYSVGMNGQDENGIVRLNRKRPDEWVWCYSLEKSDEKEQLSPSTPAN